MPSWREQSATDINSIRAINDGVNMRAVRQMVGRWLHGQAAERHVRASQVPWPSLRRWRSFSDGPHPTLPSPEIIANNLARQYPGASQRRLVRILLAETVHRLDPHYIRQAVDPAGDAPLVSMRRQRSENSPLVMYLYTKEDIAIGRATMYAVDTESRQEVWMDPLGLARGTLPEYRTATHTVAAEWAYARGYTLRTPPEKPMSDITAGTWRRFIEAGVAQVVAPLKPANDEHTLHTGHVYVGPPILE